MTRVDQNESQHDENEDIIVSFNGKEYRLQEWTKKQVAATEEDHALDWKKTFQDQKRIDERGDSDYDNESASTVTTSQHKKKKNKRKNRLVRDYHGLFMMFLIFLKYLWMPLLTAIIVGLGIGFTILILFSHNGRTPAKAEMEVSSNQVSTHSTATQNGSRRAQLLALSLTKIQGGVFSTKKAAEARVSELAQKKGIPSVMIKEGSRYTVFVGIVTSDSAKAKLQNTLASKGIDVYSKGWSYHIQTLHTTDFIYRDLKDGRATFLACLDVSSQRLAVEKPSQSILNKAHKSLSDFQLPNQSQAGGTLRSQLKMFHDTLSAAFNQIKGGGTGQQPLLSALNSYQKILQNLSK